MRNALGNLALVGISALIGAALVEVALRVAGVNPEYLAFRLLYREAFQFQWVAQKPHQPPPPQFSALTGWSNFRLTRQENFFLLEDVGTDLRSGDGWRPSIERFAIPKTRRRIVLIGDSFLYGWYVSANETVEYYLKEDLGDEFEVVNLATRGFGIGQMALVATEVAPQLEPDVIIVGFITEDLLRSCQDFSTITQLAAPKFDIVNGELIKPRPVPTPMEVWQRNQTLHARLRNALIGTLYRLRVVNLAMEPFLRWGWQACQTNLNVALLDFIRQQDQAPTIIYHLDGEPPDELLDEARSRNITILSMPNLIGRSAPPGKHPDAALNKLYASEMARSIRKSLQWSGLAGQPIE